MTTMNTTKKPVIMGIINVTPDSFFEASRCQNDEKIISQATKMIEEGASILDIGACSTRPGSDPVSEEEEMRRMRHALGVIRKLYPEVPISIDTFRASVAEMSVKEFGAQIINDVYGCDEKMYETVGKLGCTYVLMHCHEVDSTSKEDLIKKIFTFFAKEIEKLKANGVKDIIVDPGFGFGKTMEENFALLSMTKELKAFGYPILVGISRKRMIWQTLEITPADALNGTTILNALSLTQGADILRVHDVKEAKQCVELYMKYIASY